MLVDVVHLVMNSATRWAPDKRPRSDVCPCLPRPLVPAPSISTHMRHVSSAV